MADLKAQAQVPCIPLAKLADAFRERDRYKVVLQSVAAQVQGLRAGYAGIFSRFWAKLSSLRDRLGPLLNEFKPSSPS